MSNMWIILIFFSTFAKGSFSTYSYDILQDEIQYRLPNDTKPEFYDIFIAASIHNQIFTYEGSVAILLLVTSETSSITLHSHRLHTIRSLSLLTEESHDQIQLKSHTYDDRNNFLTIPLSGGVLEQGERFWLNIVFDGVLQDDPRGFFKSSYIDDSGNVRYVATTRFAMTEARHAFPCYDEATLRANFTIKIKHGSNYHAVSNMPINGTPMVENNGMATTAFLATPPSPTYILGFTISDFEYASNENSSSGSIPLRTFARPNAMPGATYSVEIGEKILIAYDDYFGIKFALPKMDQVAVANFPFGGMESWGMVVYKESALLLFPNSTHTTKTLITKIMVHEFAHQWFGDLVTPKWWTYAWLSEGFARFYEYFATNWVYPEWNINDYYVYYILQKVFQYDAEDITHAMSFYVETPAAIKDILDTITYNKASAVIRMMMHAITESVFKSGLNNYLRKRAYLAADENDLFEALAESITDNVPPPNRVNISAIMSSWTQQKGYPFLTITRNYFTGAISVRQDRYQSYIPDQVDSTFWWIPLTYASASSNDFSNTSAQLWLSNTERSITITQNGEWTADDWIIFNKQETGYYRVLYDIDNYKLITKELVDGNLNKIHLSSRSQLIDDAFNFAKAGRLDYAVVFELISYLKNEREFVPWASAFRGLDFIHNMTAASASYHHLQTFTLSLVNGLFEYIGVHDLADTEPHFNKDLRILATNWACRMGSQKCIQATTAELRQNWENIHQNMRPTIYCHGLRSNYDGDFQSLKTILDNTIDSNERNSLLTALGCSQNENRLQEYIQTSIGNNYSSARENYRVFTAVMQNGQLGLKASIQFLENSLSEAVAAYGNTNINNAMIAIASNIASSDLQERLLTIMRAAVSNGLISINAYNETRKILQANKDWLADRQQSIDNWLNDYYKSSGNRATTNSLSAVLMVLACLRYLFYSFF